MAEQLYLQEARLYPAELGAALTYDFGSGNAEAYRELLKQGAFEASGLFHDPIGGVLMGVPDEDFADFTGTGQGDSAASWSSVNPAFKRGTAVSDEFYAAAMQFTGDKATEWELLGADTEAGTAKWLRLITYADTQSPIEVRFGGKWRLRLLDSGEAELAAWVDEVDGDGNVTGGDYQARTRFRWMATGRFQESMHWLWVYEIGRKLVIRSWFKNLDGETAGVAVEDTAPYVDAEAEPDADGNLPEHALGPGAWTYIGTGPVTIAESAQSFVAQTATLTHVQPVELVNGSTQPVEVTTFGHGTPTVTVTTTDQDDNSWPQTGSSFSPAKTKLNWSLSWETAADASYYLACLALKLPRLLASDGNTGTDVAGLVLSDPADVALKHVDLVREGDLTRERLSVRFSAYRHNLAAYVQPNMLLRYVIDGTTAFRGLTDGGEWGNVIDSSPQTGELSLEAQGLWKRFRKARWAGLAPFDGRRLVDVVAELVEAAGLDSSQYDITSDWDYVFPTPPDGEPPALVFRPGTSIDQILEDLQAKFYGTSLIHYFRPSDGKFVLEALSPSASVVSATFYETNAAATAAGASGQVILDRTERQTLDETEMANLVAVIGQRANGEPLLAKAIDWASIQDPNASNYVAEVWPLIVIDPGLQTQAAVNWACRSLYERQRRPRIYIEWRSVHLHLFPGQVVYLSGGNHGQYVVLKGVSAARGADGDEADPQGRATYAGEVLT